MYDSNATDLPDLFEAAELERVVRVCVRTASYAGLEEEVGFAYKDIDRVVQPVDGARISRPVVRFAPIGNVKG